MRMNTQRILAALLSLVLLLALAPAGWAENVEAAGGGETEEETVPEFLANSNTVNIELVPKDKEGTKYETDVVKANIVADFYLLAEAKPVKGYDTYQYEFGEAPVVGTDLPEFNKALVDELEPENQNNPETMLKKFTPIARAFAEVILTHNGVAEINPVADVTETINGSKITITGLKAGLYMVVLHGSDLVKRPAEGEEEKGYVTQLTKKGGTDESDEKIYVTRALSDDYEFFFEPQLITVPTRFDDDNNQQYNTAYGTKWSNVLNIVAKPDWKPRYGDMQIIKTLNGYFGIKPATFVFNVEATFNNKTVYSDVITLVFDGNGTKQSTLLKKIPVGAEVTVTEVYSGAYKEDDDVTTYTYKSTVEGATETEGASSPIIDVEKMLCAEFVNGPGENPPGGGIVNHFTYHPENVADWGLTNPTDNADS